MEVCPKYFLTFAESRERAERESESCSAQRFLCLQGLRQAAVRPGLADERNVSPQRPGRTPAARPARPPGPPREAGLQRLRDLVLAEFERSPISAGPGGRAPGLVLVALPCDFVEVLHHVNPQPRRLAVWQCVAVASALQVFVACNQFLLVCLEPRRPRSDKLPDIKQRCFGVRAAGAGEALFAAAIAGVEPLRAPRSGARNTAWAGERRSRL